MFMHFSCIRTIFSSFWYCCWFGTLICVCMCVCVCLSLSLFWIVCAWHPSTKLLHPGTLYILRHLLHLILHLFMSSSVMRRPVKTSWRTSLSMAFIRNARSSFWIFLILTCPLSFIEGVGSPFVTSQSAVHTGVLLQYARIWLLHTSLFHFCSRYTYCSHTKAYLQWATRPEGIASWLPRLSSS